jgi:peptidoglycan/xylan/chitin deacetylase (PgdA/CDA1 family)
MLLPGVGLAADLLITHGPRNLPRVALTFDVCQVPGKPSGFDRKIVEVLRQSATPATFFLGGEWLRTHPQEARELAAVADFELANHSFSHPDLRRSSGAEIAAEIAKTEALLVPLRGASPRLFRLPFGYHDARVLEEVAAQQVRIIQWDVVSGDPDPAVSAAAMIAVVPAQTRNGSILIFHANGRGWHTAEALPQIIAALRRKGFELVTVGTLLTP